MNKHPRHWNLSPHSALRFIILMGMVSLFADITYEGARSITGPYLALLGASGAIVGFVSGFGELIGYSLRYLSGYLSDRFRSYWSMIILGYAINLFAVPLLALTVSWQAAALLLMTERLGKGIRVPARDAMLSYAGHATGRGLGFGIHDALDQIGAVLGPAFISAILFFQHSYAFGFAFLLLPALCALSILLIARKLYPHPDELEASLPAIKSEGMKHSYWLYLGAASCIAAGFVDYPLIAYHFEKTKVASPGWIPLIYSIAMGVEGIAALVLGRWFDRKGIAVLMISTGLSACLAPLVFLGGFEWAVAGMILWGIGMGAQESIMRAMVAQFIDSKHRSTGYGLFSFWFGISWFAGSFLMGTLYDISIAALVLFSVVIQLLSLPILWIIKRRGF